MKEKKKILILSSVIIGVLVVLLGLTYAIFSYSKLGSNGELVLGEIYMHYTETKTFSLDNAFPSETYNPAKYFEFTIDGKNTHEAGGILYNIQVTHGDENTSKTRIDDNHLKFRLVEVNDDDTETVLVDGESYQTLNNTTMYSNIIPKNTRTEVEYKYRVYVWISDEVTIGNTEGVSYTQEEWANLYANVKINVTGEYTKGEFLTTKIKSKLGTEGLVAVNTNGELYTGSGEIREYRYTGKGNYCTYSNGTTDYTISVEGDTCPTNVCTMGTIAFNNDNDVWPLGAAEMGAESVACADMGGTVVGLKVEGSTPTDSGLRNYIEFNDEMWRIIGVFGDNIKIMRDMPLEYNTYTSDANYTYTSGNTTYIFKTPYINGTLPTTKYQTFTYNYFATDSSASYNNNWANSGAMHYLNDTTANSYYTTKLSAKAKKLIDDTTYYLGNVSVYPNAEDVWTMHGTASDVYNQERGSVVCAETVTRNTHENSCNVWYGNQATWTGKVGLIYPSDYAYASSSENWTKDVETYATNVGSFNNWMLNTDSYVNWILSPASDRPDSVAGCGIYGGLGSGYAYVYSALRPTLYLKSSVIVTSGDGSYSNPYKLLG